MSHAIEQLNIDGINRHLSATGYTAKRGQINPNEIIIGKDGDVKGCITVKLADNPSADNRPTWYVGIFRETTPKEISRECELAETPVLLKAEYWADMLTMVSTAVVGM